MATAALAITLSGASASSAPISGGEAPRVAPDSAYAAQVLADGPVSYWRLGEA